MSYGRTMVAFTCQRTATKNGPRWGSNPRRAAFQTAALPAELPGQDFILRHERAAQPPAFPAANKSHTRARKKKPAVFKGRGPGSGEETCAPTHMITDPVPKPELSSRSTPTAAPPRGTLVANQLWPLCPRYILDQLLQRRRQRQQEPLAFVKTTKRIGPRDVHANSEDSQVSHRRVPGAIRGARRTGSAPRWA